MADADLEILLTAVVKKKFGSSAAVTGLSRLTAGASSESWHLEVETADFEMPLAMIFRRPPQESGVSDVDEFSARIAPGRRFEAAILGVLKEAGLAVPAVQFELQPEDGLGDGYAMDFMSGAPLPHRILKDDDYREARRNLPGQIAKFRHQMSSIDPARFDFLPEDTALSQIQMFEDMLDWLQVRHAGIEIGISWLKDHLPEPAPAKLVHGDFRLSNYLITKTGLNAVIDWELTHLGDPMEDLGWPCIRSWRFSRPDLPVAGLTDRRSFLTAWKDASGEVLRLEQLIFWEVLGNIKWAILCLLQGHRYVCGVDKSIEMAVIGRRAEEAVFDLLRLLDGRDGDLS